MDSVTINFKLPSSWAELSDKHLRFIFGLIAQGSTTEEIQVLCLLQWSGTKVMGRGERDSYILRMGKALFEVTPLTIATLLPHLAWMGLTPEVPVRPNVINRRAAIPADFVNVPFESYIVCDNYFQGFLANQQDSFLDEIGRVVYGDHRMHFQPWQRIAIFYWMVALKDYLARLYPDFFQPSTSDGPQNLLAPNQYSPQETVNAMIRALTKGDITKESEILALDTHRALTELNAQAREYQRIKAMEK